MIQVKQIELNIYLINNSNLNDLFNGCTSLKNVSLSATNIVQANNVFEGCDSLIYMDLSQFNANDIEINNFFPINAKNVLLKYNSSIFGDLNEQIPENWTKFDVFKSDSINDNIFLFNY